MTTKTVLFLCTGNYYRSRFAAHLFNHLVARNGLNWQADSRGLAAHFGDWNVGPISAFAVAGLEDRGIAVDLTTERMPLRCTADDLAAADLIVAVKESEHRPMLETRYPGWADRVRYWGIHDLDQASSAEALPRLDAHVRALVRELEGR